ncbi:hypothetical protein [Tenacibaculum sp. 190524A02b]|uniref:hypothetical protein n=1 Tax=Tenacibaculum vairaonense TaxID=3137860 RepID=UPI0031FAE53B
MKKITILIGALFLGALASNIQAQGWHETTYGQGLSFIVNSDRIPKAESFRVLYGADRENLFEINPDMAKLNSKNIELKSNGEFNIDSDKNILIRANNSQLLANRQASIVALDEALISTLAGSLKLDKTSVLFEHRRDNNDRVNIFKMTEGLLDFGEKIATKNYGFKVSKLESYLHGGGSYFNIKEGNLTSSSTKSNHIHIATDQDTDVSSSFEITHGTSKAKLLTVNKQKVSMFSAEEVNMPKAVLKTKDIVANKVTLKVGSFPDYVFANNYNLMPLQEVASFIKKHQHLPNMKSEKEVVKEGMDLKELTLKLVEKVEELTLYTIQQQKLIDNLQAKLTTLKK